MCCARLRRAARAQTTRILADQMKIFSDDSDVQKAGSEKIRRGQSDGYATQSGSAIESEEVRYSETARVKCRLFA